MTGKWKFTPNTPKKNDDRILQLLGQKYDIEHIQYALEIEHILSLLEEGMHSSDDPREIVLAAMKTACEFYQADWCGFLEVDLDLNVWAPLIWYSPDVPDETMSVLSEFESAEFFPSWIKAMKDNDPIIISDVSVLKAQFPEEYAMYQRLGVSSILAVPILPRPFGFLVVRNPQRYANKSSMLRMLGVVILSNINEFRFFESAKMSLTPDVIQNDKDIIMNFFGNLEIITSSGILHEEEFNAPKVCRVVSYIVLNKGTHPPLEIANALWPNDNSDEEALCSNIRGHLYRFNKKFSLVSKYRLIESTAAGYRVNPELHITTDLEQFDKCWEAVQHAGNAMMRIEILKQAASIYRGPLFYTARDEHWIMSMVSHYNIRYSGIINELLARLAENNDYINVGKYASESLKAMPGNMMSHYWLIHSLYYSGSLEMAKSEVDRARKELDDEEYDELIQRLKKLKGKTPFGVKIKKSFL